MSNVEDIRQGIRGWILTVYPALPVLFDDTNKGQPDEQYISIKHLSTRWYAHALQTIDADETETIHGYGKLSFSIQVIGGIPGDPVTDAVTVAQRIVNSLESIKAENYLVALGIGYNGLTAGIDDISVLVGERWENRAVFTALFDARITDIFVPEWANAAEILNRAHNPVDVREDLIVVPKPNPCT